MVERGTKQKRVTCRAGQAIDFEYSARSFGWFLLAPNRWLGDRGAFQRVERLTTGRVVRWTACPSGAAPQREFHLEIEFSGCLTTGEVDEVVRGFQYIFRIDEDLSGFYDLCAGEGEHWEGLRQGRGRLLRSPTVFEDLVKTICTTNTTWARTVRMVDRLAEELGNPFGSSGPHAFPTPEAVAQKGVSFLEREVGLGYRGEYISRLARRVAGGELDPEALKDPSLTDGDLKRSLLGIDGVGSYSVSTMLMLLGRYGDLALDTEMVKHVGGKYYGGRRPSMEEIHRVYRSWGRWKYLAYWFDPPAPGAAPKNPILGLHVGF